MANTITRKVLANGFRNYAVAVALQADGSGEETDYVVADPTSGGDMGVAYLGQTFYPTTYLKIWKIEYEAQGLAAKLEWDATTDDLILTMADGAYKFDYSKFGGRGLPSGLAGATGKILLTTIGAAMAGASVSFTIHCHKCLQNT